MFNISSNFYTYVYACILEPICHENYFHSCMIYLKMSSISKILFILFFGLGRSTTLGAELSAQHSVDWLCTEIREYLCTWVCLPTSRPLQYQCSLLGISVDRSVDRLNVSASVCDSVDWQVIARFWTSLSVDRAVDCWLVFATITISFLICFDFWLFQRVYLRFLILII